MMSENIETEFVTLHEYFNKKGYKVAYVKDIEDGTLILIKEKKKE